MANELGNRIAEQALTWVRTPFRHAGREKGLSGGVDCVGVLICVAHELGISDYENRVYSRHVDTDYLRGEIEQLCSAVPSEAMQPGDLLLLKVDGQPVHVGVLSRDGFFVHAWETVGFVVESKLCRFWKERIAAVYRVDPSKVDI